MAKRIFISDNNVNVVHLLEKKLAAMGYEIIATSNGKEVLRTININNIPQLIVLDANLQGETCLKICQELKREKRTLAIPILILREKNVDERPYREIKINQFIERPCEINTVIQRCDRILGSVTGTSEKHFQPKSKLSVATVFGSAIVIICVLALIFFVFVPLFSAKK